VCFHTKGAHTVAALYDVVLYTPYPRMSSVTRAVAHDTYRQGFDLCAHVHGVYHPCVFLFCVAQDALDTRAFIHARRIPVLRPCEEALCTHAVARLHDVIGTTLDMRTIGGTQLRGEISQGDAVIRRFYASRLSA